jgi:hypothetical protein
MLVFIVQTGLDLKRVYFKSVWKVNLFDGRSRKDDQVWREIRVVGSISDSTVSP